MNNSEARKHYEKLAAEAAEYVQHETCNHVDCRVRRTERREADRRGHVRMDNLVRHVDRRCQP